MMHTYTSVILYPQYGTSSRWLPAPNHPAVPSREERGSSFDRSAAAGGEEALNKRSAACLSLSSVPKVYGCCSRVFSEKGGETSVSRPLFWVQAS